MSLFFLFTAFNTFIVDSDQDDVKDGSPDGPIQGPSEVLVLDRTPSSKWSFLLSSGSRRASVMKTNRKYPK